MLYVIIHFKGKLSKHSRVIYSITLCLVQGLSIISDCRVFFFWLKQSEFYIVWIWEIFNIQINTYTYFFVAMETDSMGQLWYLTTKVRIYFWRFCNPTQFNHCQQYVRHHSPLTTNYMFTCNQNSQTLQKGRGYLVKGPVPKEAPWRGSQLVLPSVQVRREKRARAGVWAKTTIAVIL